MLIKFLIWIPIICIVIGVIYGICLFAYLRRKDKINFQKAKKEDESAGHYLINGDSYQPIQDFMEFETFVGNMVKFDEHNHAVILEVSSLNIIDMSEKEIEILESALKIYYTSLSFSVKELTFSRSVDLDTTYEYWNQNVQLRTGAAKQIGLSIMKHGIESTSNARLQNKNNYILIPYCFEPDEKNAMYTEEDILEETKMNLQIRVDTVIAGLQKAGLDVTVLDLDNLIEFYYSSFNRVKSNSLKLREILESSSNNIMSDFVVSRKPEPNEKLLHYSEIVEKIRNELGLDPEECTKNTEEHKEKMCS